MGRDARKSKLTPIGVLILLIPVVIVGGIVYLYHKDSSPAVTQLNPAPRSNPDELLRKAQSEEKTLDQIKSELEESQKKRANTKEAKWVIAGETEKIIESYRAIAGISASVQEKRVRLLDHLKWIEVPRAKWPSSFNDTKAKQLVDFLVDVLLGRIPGSGGEVVTAQRHLVAFAEQNPEFIPQAEKALITFFAQDQRIGPRGECIKNLARLRTKTAVQFIIAQKSRDQLVFKQSLLYALETLYGTSYESEARRAILQIGNENKTLKPLAGKILANHGDPTVKKWVPYFLREQASPAEIEAGVYAVGKLRLKEFRSHIERLVKAGKLSAPFLGDQVEKVLKDL